MLIIEDDNDIRTVAQRALMRVGYRVLLAEDGLVGIAKLSEYREQVAIVLLDLAMPRMGGIETYRAIRQLRPDVPVVLWSASNRDWILRQFGEWELVEFLQKPFSIRELLDSLQRALGSYN